MEAALSKHGCGQMRFGFLLWSKEELTEQTLGFKVPSPARSFLISALSLVSFHPWVVEHAEEWQW